MRIVVDARILHWPGVGRYARELLAQLETMDRDNEYLVLVRHQDWFSWQPTKDNFVRVVCDIEPYSLGEQLKLPFAIRALRPDVVHFLTANSTVLPVGRAVRRVVTVHDLTLLDFDTSRGSWWRRCLQRLRRPVFAFVVWRQVRSAHTVLTPTEYVREAVVRRLGASSDRVRVTPEAVTREWVAPQPIDRLAIDGPFLLYVGSAFPYKNVGLVIRAMPRLGAGPEGLRLVITSKDDDFRRRLEALVDELDLADRVLFTGYVSDGELATLYGRATAYVSPSLSEGFGLQAIEAMAHGTPVLAARASCLPEVCGEAATYFDPTDPDDLARTVEALVMDPDGRRSISAAGRAHAATFSWARTAELTHGAYLCSDRLERKP